MTVTEVHDPIARRTLAARLVRTLPRAYQDNVAPCRHRCLFCSQCSKAYEFTVKVFGHPDTTIYEVIDGHDHLGVIFFTGSMVHGCFFDGKIWGKGRAVREAVRRFRLRHGGDVTAQVPANSRPISRWLQRVGFRFSRTKERDFLFNGTLHDVDVLEWDS